MLLATAIQLGPFATIAKAGEKSIPYFGDYGSTGAGKKLAETVSFQL